MVNSRAEPPRDSRRLHFLRGWSHEYIEEVFPGSPGTCGPAGLCHLTPPVTCYLLSEVSGISGESHTALTTAWNVMDAQCHCAWRVPLKYPVYAQNWF